ncbi:MAG: hypothetical protein AAF670_09180, partial [Planctomycetota bacterium]
FGNTLPAASGPHLTRESHGVPSAPSATEMQMHTALASHPTSGREQEPLVNARLGDMLPQMSLIKKRVRCLN